MSIFGTGELAISSTASCLRVSDEGGGKVPYCSLVCVGSEHLHCLHAAIAIFEFERINNVKNARRPVVPLLHLHLKKKKIEVRGCPGAIFMFRLPLGFFFSVIIFLPSGETCPTPLLRIGVMIHPPSSNLHSFLSTGADRDLPAPLHL